MRLCDWAKQQGIAYVTAWRWFKTGKLPVRAIQTPSGAILVDPQPSPRSSRSAWIYCRVSSHEKKADLQRQVERCIEFCRANGWSVESITKEIASGMNDKRPKLLKLLESKPDRIVVEHKDRLTCFGFGYFEILLPQLGCDLIVINRDAEEQEDLMKDLISIVTSFCCRLYGLRRGRNKAKAVKEIIECNELSK